MCWNVGTFKFVGVRQSAVAVAVSKCEIMPVLENANVNECKY